jgi:hypothetical protein
LEVYDNGLLVMVACLFLYMFIFYGSAKGNTTRSAEDRTLISFLRLSDILVALLPISRRFGLNRTSFLSLSLS